MPTKKTTPTEQELEKAWEIYGDKFVGVSVGVKLRAKTSLGAVRIRLYCLY